VGTEVHTARTYYSRQNQSNRDLLLYNSRSFIISPKCRTPPQSLTTTFAANTCCEPGEKFARHNSTQNSTTLIIHYIFIVEKLKYLKCIELDGWTFISVDDWHLNFYAFLSYSFQEFCSVKFFFFPGSKAEDLTLHSLFY